MAINPNARTEIRCGGCGVHEGEMHIIGCELERCPFCGCQLLTCRCKYDRLGLVNEDRFTAETNYLPPEIYSEGIQGELWERWLGILYAKGRYPFIRYPTLCSFCGDPFPEFFTVPDEEWNRFVQPDKQEEVICKSCFDYIKHISSSSQPKIVESPRFTDWLSLHLGEETYVGDLARFVVNDSWWPIESDEFEPFWKRMIDVRATDELLIALEEAWQLFIRSADPVNFVS